MIPKIPLTFHSPSRGKAVPPFPPRYQFCLAGPTAQIPKGTVKLVVPITNPCGVNSARVSIPRRSDQSAYTSAHTAAGQVQILLVSGNHICKDSSYK